MSRPRSAHAGRVLFRRSPWVFAGWSRGRSTLYGSRSGSAVQATPLLLAILDALDDWLSLERLAARLELPPGRTLARLVGRLVAERFIDQHTGPARPPSGPVHAAAEPWGDWHPVAALFHHGTRDVAYEPKADAERRLRARARRDPPPEAVLRRAGRGIGLPAPTPRDVPSGALLARRTWRAFGRGALTQGELSTLLWFTWGIQAWAKVEGLPEMPLTTSPSPGARHAVEVYVLVKRVRGLKPGLYHYRADANQIARLPAKRLPPASTLLPTQDWTNDAAVVCFMTTVFDRIRWRYGHPRAYRTALIEVGHQAQTFCLLATAMGLAPFSTMALADSKVERLIGADGTSEAVMYAVGAGKRPPGVEWAPWPGTTRTPRLRKNGRVASGE